MGFGVKSGHFGVEIWGFRVRNWVFLWWLGGGLGPVHFGVNLGHFGSEIWVFGVRSVGFFFVKDEVV